MFSPDMQSDVSTMSTTWWRRSSRRWATQSPGSGYGLPSTFSSVASTSSSPAHGSRRVSRTTWVVRAQRADEAGGAPSTARAASCSA